MLLDGTRNHTFAFTHAERDELGLRGMVPAGPAQTLDAQVKLVMEGLSRIEDVSSSQKRQLWPRVVFIQQLV